MDNAQLGSTLPPAGVIHAANTLAKALATETENLGSIGTVQDLKRYMEYVDYVTEAASQAAYPGLPEICQLFQESLHAVTQACVPLTESQRSLLRLWPGLVQAYVESPGLREAGEALVEHLCNPCWGPVVSEEDAAMLKAILTSPEEDFEASGLDLEVDVREEWKGEDASPYCSTGQSLRDEEGVRDEGALPTQPIPLEQLPRPIQELVELLLSELPEIEASIATITVTVESLESEAQKEALERLADQIQRFGAAAEAIGFIGLAELCLYTQENLLVLARTQHALNINVTSTLQDWITHLQSYLMAPGDPCASEFLIELLSASILPRPLPVAEAERVSALLLTPDLGNMETDPPSRPQTAIAEDVSLALPRDVNPDLLDALLQELPAQTEAFSDAIQSVMEGGSLEEVNVAQRIAHTLKGAGNTVGVRGIATLTHYLEDILLALAKHATLPSRPLAETMLNAADCLTAMSEALLGTGEPPKDAMAVLQEVLDWANRIDNEGLVACGASLATDDERSELTALEGQTATLDNQAPRHAERAQEGARSETQRNNEAQAVPMLRVPAGLIDDLLRLVGETIILTGQVHERLRQTAGQAAAMQAQFQLLQQLGAQLEEFIDVKNMNSAVQYQNSVSSFDPLEMDQYNELHTCSRRLVEAATDAREIGQFLVEYLAKLEDMLISQERFNREIQEAVLRTRMVPVKTVLPRMQRIVRQTCRLTGKQAELHVSGADTLMDNEVLNNMVDPLMHLLRNAVDHGIEDSDTRLAMGKDPKGNIRLEFLREGNNILVRCWDDGTGLDFNAIRRSAQECGLISADKTVAREELKRFILRPNFSTRTQTTQTSGRGIGMDVAYSRTMELGGSMTLYSEAGKGLMIELRLPFTLISTHALLVRIGPQVFAIANRGIEQILYSEGGELRHFGNELIFQIDQATYPTRTLESMLNMSAVTPLKERRAYPVIMVRGEAGITGVIVEAVLDSRDLVVKSLSQYIPKLHGIIGATILGDGTVTPVFDLPELLRVPHQRIAESHAEARVISREDQSLPSALIVDDSLSARRSLAQFLGDSGFEVRMARDGIEAIECIAERQPDILLVDLEMPRMNGIELTAHVRGHEATRGIPIIMITSRTTSKHRQQAEAVGVNTYLNKPFAEDMLLEHIYTLMERQ